MGRGMGTTDARDPAVCYNIYGMHSLHLGPGKCPTLKRACKHKHTRQGHAAGQLARAAHLAPDCLEGRRANNELIGKGAHRPRICTHLIVLAARRLFKLVGRLLGGALQDLWRPAR